MRFRGSDIQSFMPSVDPRARDDIRVLAGRNFIHDSRGPKSGFDNRILTPFRFGAETGVEGARAEGLDLVFTNEAMLRWTSSGWDILYLWDDFIETAEVIPWFLEFMEGKWYASHTVRGFFEISHDPVTDKYTAVQKDADDIPGLPEGILGMSVIRNMMILVTEDAIYWSSIGLVDFTPTLGGAGFQLISSFVKGDYLATTGFQAGFTVWTTGGSVMAEFIGGDLIWRWTPVPSLDTPYGPRATITLANGASVLFTQRGLKVTANGEPAKDWTPDFNEYLRDYLQDNQLRPSYWLLAYDPIREWIFLAESVDGRNYWRTLVLTPTIDKWGEFSTHVTGWIPLPDGRFGYVDSDGIARYFFDNMGQETSPPNELGLNRVYPRKQKDALLAPSSSFVCFAANDEFANRTTRARIDQPGWAEATSLIIQPYGLMGMDSWIELGYFRPAALQIAADEGSEIHEIQISTPISTPWFDPDFTVEGLEDQLYFETEDWETYPDESEDWNLIPDGVADEDWNGPFMGYRPFQFEIRVEASMDGVSFMLSENAELAQFAATARTFTLTSVGEFHRIRISAGLETDQYYHVSYLELTLAYGGQNA